MWLRAARVVFANPPNAQAAYRTFKPQPEYGSLTLAANNLPAKPYVPKTYRTV